MNKYIILTFISLAVLSSKGFSQQKVEHYCVIHASDWTANFQTLKKVTIDYGQIENHIKLKDSLEVKSLEQVKKCKTEASLMNYMASIGWTWVSSREPQQVGMIILVYKKNFDASDFETMH